MTAAANNEGGIVEPIDDVLPTRDIKPVYNRISWCLEPDFERNTLAIGFAKEVAFICVSLSANRIMQKKLLDRFSENSVEMLHMGHERNRYILVVIQITLR